jgi:hypothetical protein
MLSMCFQTIKFFSLTLLYHSMHKKVPSNKLIKILASNKPLTISTIVTTIIWIVYGILSVLLIELNITPYLLVVFIYTTAIISALYCTIVLVLFIVDIFTFLKNGNYSIRNYFFISDPLHFRLDTMLIIPIIICGILEITFPFYVGFLGTEIIDIPFITLIIFCSAGNVCISCIIDHIQGISYTPTQVQGLSSDKDYVNQIVFDENASKFLYQYSEKEFSLENVLAYIEITGIEKQLPTLSPIQVDDVMNNIYDRYMKPSSDRAVNVPADVAKKFNTFYTRREGEVQDVLHSVTSALMVNLLDTYSRFKLTQEHKECIKILNTKKDLIQALDM